MNILAFDTSTNNLGIALKSGENLYTITSTESLKHSEKLLPLIDSLFSHAALSIQELNLIICAKGPGSFTGLRIGIATAKGIAFALSIPIVSVPTLDFMAYDFSWFDGAVIPVIDARRDRYYSAIYENGMRKTEYLDATAEEIVNSAHHFQKILITGPDSSKLYNEIYKKQLADIKNINVDSLQQISRISSCLEIGLKMYQNNITDSEDSGPIYVRKSDAEEKSAAG